MCEWCEKSGKEGWELREGGKGGRPEREVTQGGEDADSVMVRDAAWGCYLSSTDMAALWCITLSHTRRHCW